MERLLATLTVLVFIGFCAPLQAQTLLLEGISKEPPNALEGVPRPKPGMTAKRVKEIFGVPKAKGESVGSPPITRWVYKDFIVVFEGDLVINSVLKKPEYTDLNN